MFPPVNEEEGLFGNVSFVTGGGTQIQLTQKDVLHSFRSCQVVNLLERDLIAYSTDDIVLFMDSMGS